MEIDQLEDGISSLGGIHSELIAMKTEVEKSNDGVKTIAQFKGRLMGMLKELQVTQAKHEKIAETMFKQCKEENKFRAKEIIAAKQAYVAASNSFAKCQSSLAAAKQNLPTLKNAHIEYTKLLAKRTAQRLAAHKRYLQRANDWKEAIMFLNDFSIAVKTKLSTGVSFADLSEHLLKHASKMGFMAEVVPLLTEIAQSPAELATSVPSRKHSYVYLNQGGVVKSLLAHLEKLKNKLIVDARQNDLNEEKAQKRFDKMRVRLDAIIGKLASDIAKTRAQIHEMKICVATEGAIMQTANNKLLRNKRLKKAARHTCSDFAREFVEATRNRLAEIRTLQEVLRICQRRFGQLPKDLMKYLEEVKNGFKRYTNSTQFQKYVKYVEKHIADNVYGKALAHGKRHVPRKLEAEILAKRNLRRLGKGKPAPRVVVVGSKAGAKLTGAAARRARRAARRRARNQRRRAARRAHRRRRHARRRRAHKKGVKLTPAQRAARRAARAKRRAARRAARAAARKRRRAARRLRNKARRMGKRGKKGKKLTKAQRAARRAARAKRRAEKRARRKAARAKRRARARAARERKRNAQRAARLKAQAAKPQSKLGVKVRRHGHKKGGKRRKHRKH